MTTLRVRVAAPWDPGRAHSWALYDAQDGRLAEGRDASAGWPDHDRLEIVLGAPGVRIVALALPAMASDRVRQAARFAVEDQIAAESAATTHVAVSTQRRDGTLLALLVPRAAIAALHPRERALAKLRRVVAEPGLAVPAAGWRWCRGDEANSGFVRLPDGSAFGASDAPPGGPLPVELALALRESKERGITVRVECAAEPEDLARWSRETGVEFVAGPPWRWQDVAPAAFTTATDLLQGELALASHDERARPMAVLAPAAWLLALALAVHVFGTVAEWASLRLAQWQAGSQWQALGLAAGLPAESLGSPDAIRTAIARRRADLLHGHRLFAADDALPLLARASPAVRVLAAGTVRRAIYADGHWTLELAGPDASALLPFERSLRSADLEALIVPVPGGARVRFGVSP